jgi:hypothetical protein
MNRIPFPMLILSLPLVIVLCGATELHAKADDDDNAAQLKAAQDERVKVLTELVQELTKYYKLPGVNTIEWFPQLFSAENELYNALPDSKNSEKRVALLTKQLSEANDFVKITQAMREAGTVQQWDVLRAKSMCLEAKIKLLKERSGIRPPTPTSTAKKP